MIRELDDLLKNFKGSPLTMKPNYMKIPVSRVGMDEVGADLFNKIYRVCKEQIGRKLERSKSGAIKLSTLRLPSYDVRTLSYCVELTILCNKNYRIQFRGKIRELDQEHSGRCAFVSFKEVMRRKFNIDLEDYAIPNGKELKQEIEKPMICLARDSMANLTFQNVNHIDFHSSYPAGLMNTHPEFTEGLKFMFAKRKTNEKYKSILDFSIGFMQSQFCGYKFTHLARDSIHDNNVRVMNLANQLKKAKRVIILYNTDGIWYIGEPYHGAGEGSDIGQWENDHINCQFRAKSAGCYEFIENGVYTAKVRGRTKLETIKPREAWQWGDIYNKDCVAIKWLFDEEKGVYQYEEEKEKKISL